MKNDVNAVRKDPNAKPIWVVWVKDPDAEHEGVVFDSWWPTEVLAYTYAEAEMVNEWKVTPHLPGRRYR